MRLGWTPRWGVALALIPAILCLSSTAAVAANLARVRLAYVVDGTGPNHIYFARENGSHRSVFVKGRDPAWSPNGARLTYRTGNPQHPGGNPTRINIIRADGTHRRLVRLHRRGEASGEAGPAVWSPNGRWIAFDTLLGIYVMHPTGERMHLVSRFPGHRLACYDLEPSWSPNGKRLVFAVLCDGNDLGLWTINRNGTDRTQLVGTGARFADASQPAWSPDGRRIAFIGVRQKRHHHYRHHVYTVRPNGTGLSRLTRGRIYPYSPQWSLGGRRIAFTDYRHGVFVMNAHGSDLTRLPLGSKDACCLTWRPDTAR